MNDSEVCMMTNVKTHRKDVLSDREIDVMLSRAEQLITEYHRLRAKALVSLFKSGKRRAEVGSLEMTDLATDSFFLYVTFTTVKKRKKSMLATRRRKRYPLDSHYAKHISEYWEWMKQHHPECKFLFPAAHVVFGVNYHVSADRHLSGRQILRIIKELNPRAWCHLFRETRGAEVVKKDEGEKGQADIFTVYKVKQALDLEREQTAWNYINRYATETVGEEEGVTVE